MDNDLGAEEMKKIAFGIWLDVSTGRVHADDGFGNLVMLESYAALIYSAGDANLIFDLF